MSGLALTRAPDAGRPLRFLLTSPLWGMVAGFVLIAAPDAFSLGRWAPATVVLVHVFTLGVLGNAMLGSLLQFLPVAAGVPHPGLPLSHWAHAGLNLGLVLFLCGLLHAHALLLPASALMIAALLAIAAPVLPALLRNGARRVLRAGLGSAIVALAATIVLGVLAAAVLAGHLAWPLDRLVDAHATLGLAGWVLGLLLAVGSLTVPMFQGTAAIPSWWLAAALTAVGSVLVAGVSGRLAGAPAQMLVPALALAAIGFGLVVLRLQWRPPHRRNPALVGFWRVGSVALIAAGLTACVAAMWPHPQMVMFAGALAIGAGVPLLVNGMLLEIVAFITWIALRGRCPRGVRIPAVGRLLPDRDKSIALAAHGLAAALLAAAAAWPALTIAAGIGLAIAYATSAACLLRCLWRARTFAGAHGGQA